MVEHLLAKERVESSNLFIRLIRSVLPIGIGDGPFEAQLFVEVGTVGRHEIDPFFSQHSRIIQQGFRHLLAQSEFLQISSYHDVP